VARAVVVLSAVPRQNPIAKREVEICARVRLIREQRKLSRVAFASAMNVDSSELSRVEHQRAPLRYGLGRSLCEHFDVSQRWLATGKLPQSFYFDVSPYVESKVPLRALFSKVFDDSLNEQIEEQLKTWADLWKCKVEELDQHAGARPPMPTIGTEPHAALLFHVVQLIQANYWRLPRVFQPEYTDALLQTVKEFTSKNSRAIERAREIQERERLAKLNPKN
jgi:transcriptional regulator with XRE-family HTH domain